MSWYGQEVGCTAECVERHLLVETLEHFGMSGLQAHGDFELTGYRISKPQTPFSIRPARNAGCDSTITRSNPAHSSGDLFVIVRRDRRRVEETASVVQLDLPRAAATWRGHRGSAWRSRLAALSQSRVLTQRSHITHRNGHSRFVRKTTAVGARAPWLSRSSSQMDAYARCGSSGRLADRCWRTKRSSDAGSEF